MRLSRTPNVGPITFFQLIERFRGDAAAALDALPSLMKKGGGSRDLSPPPKSAIDREIDAAPKFRQP